MDQLTDLEKVLFSLANLSPEKLKYAAQAIDFLAGLDKEKLSYEQVKGNYRMIAILSKYQQVYMTPVELEEMRAQQAINSRALEITQRPAPAPTQAPVKPAASQPAKNEPAACEKHCCAECSKAEDIDGKNSYCPESGKVHNKTEYHECEPFSPGKAPVKAASPNIPLLRVDRYE
jgi:hypothetical protein